MGLKYSSDDSSTLMGALTANLSTATVTLESTETACSQLCRALGSGDLSGQGYAAVNSLFAEIIRPCIVDAKGELETIQEDLDAYTQADGLVSQYGVLDEDQLNAQLVSARARRDATETLIEANRETAAASVALPGVGASLEAANVRLGLVVAQLEDDIKLLEDKLRALQKFSASVQGLFKSNSDSDTASNKPTLWRWVIKQFAIPKDDPGGLLTWVTGLAFGFSEQSSQVAARLLYGQFRYPRGAHSRMPERGFQRWVQSLRTKSNWAPTGRAGFNGLSRVAGKLGVVGAVVEGASAFSEQWEQDADLETGERVARASIKGGATAVGAAAVAWGGAQIGVAIGAVGGPVGAVIGGAVGGIIGGVIGSGIGKKIGDGVNQFFKDPGKAISEFKKDPLGSIGDALTFWD